MAIRSTGYRLSDSEMGRLERKYRPKLLVAVYREFRKTAGRIPVEDYDSAANLALGLAFRDFDPSRGWQFSTLLWKIVKSQFSRVRLFYSRQVPEESLELLVNDDEQNLAASGSDVFAEVCGRDLWEAVGAVEYGEELLAQSQGWTLRERGRTTGVTGETLRQRRIRAAREVRQQLAERSGFPVE